MKLELVKPVAAYCVGIEDGPYVLRLDSPEGDAVWYINVETGFEVTSQEHADELEVAFQASQRGKENERWLVQRL